MSVSYATHSEHLVRANIWSMQLKETFLDELFAQGYIDWLEFPDGDTLNIPSIGQFEARDYAENQQVTYSSFDTGNFTFTIDQYKQTAVYVTKKFRQDSFWAEKVISSFVPKQLRAISKVMETKILSVGPEAQTASNLNTINGGDHRFVASGSNQIMQVTDLARVKYALSRANVPMTNLVGIVDESVAYAFETLTNISSISNNPMWEGIITTGLSNGTRFYKNVYGIDLYISQNLKASAGETIDSVTVNSSGVHNVFFSAAPDVLPIVGAVRQPPQVDSEYNKDFQRDEYVTTCRYGFKLYRPENFVTVLSATDQVG